MANRKVSFAPGEYFHVYNRGNDKRQIFHDNSDYYHFLKLLFLANSENNFVVRDISRNIYSVNRGEQLVHMGAYCAMPNHFHFLLTPAKEGGLSKFMQKFSTGLSMYYNTKYKRTGTLFEGRFKAEHVDRNEYLKYLFSYIHLNPIKLIQPDWKENGIKDFGATKNFLRKYNFSSYQDFLGDQRPEGLILNRAVFPNYFPNKISFEKEVFGWISFKSPPEV